MLLVAQATLSYLLSLDLLSVRICNGLVLFQGTFSLIVEAWHDNNDNTTGEFTSFLTRLIVLVVSLNAVVEDFTV